MNASAFEDSGRFQQAEKEDTQVGTIWTDRTGRAVERDSQHRFELGSVI